MKNKSLFLCSLAEKNEEINVVCSLLACCQVCVDTEIEENLLTLHVK